MEPANQTTDEIWEEFWAPIIAEAEGEEGDLEALILNSAQFEQLKKELADYRVMMHEVSIAYCEVSGGYISKPNTMARHVIDRVEERLNEAREEGQHELLEHLYELDQGAGFAAWTLGDLADHLAQYFGVKVNSGDSTSE